MGKKHGAKARAALFADPSPPLISVSDPALAEFLGLSGVYSATMTEEKALGLTAVYRAQALIAGTIAGLPLRVYEGTKENRTPVDHWLSTNPAGPYDLSPFNWVEMVLLHLLNHAESYLKTILTEAGEIVGLWPVHPLAVTRVTWDGADKAFDVALANGASERLITGEMTQVLGMSMDGLRGMSPLALFRQSFQTSRAGEIAANRTFTSGSLISGLVTTEEDVDEVEAKAIKQSLNAKIAGAEHAGDIAFVNRSLKFSPWAMTNADAEFLSSRAFQVEEVSRIYGVPPHLLMATEKQTSWGTGVAEQNRGLARFTLMGWTSRIESAIKPVLPPTQFAEFDYAGLLQGSPAEEIDILIRQVQAGLLTVDEARAIRNLPPLPEQPDPEPEPQETPDAL
jgi:HK97 family phage portal protein